MIILTVLERLGEQERNCINLHHTQHVLPMFRMIFKHAGSTVSPAHNWRGRTSPALQSPAFRDPVPGNLAILKPKSLLANPKNINQ